MAVSARTPRLSMRSARALTGVSDRAARSLVAVGALPRTDLDAYQVLALQALAAAQGLSPSTDLELAAHRAEEIRAACQRAWHEQASDWTLVVLQEDAKIATDTDRLQAILKLTASQPRLLLPLGFWAKSLREEIQR